MNTVSIHQSWPRKSEPYYRHRHMHLTFLIYLLVYNTVTAFYAGQPITLRKGECMSKIYVGTYHKYNSGSIKGDWLELSEFANKDEFIQACIELHKDEHDPELMFQDWEDIPSHFIGESHLDEKVWDWMELSPEEKSTVAIYMDEVDHNAPFQEALDCYEGEFESEEDWAMEFWDYTGMLDEIPKFAQNYIDYEQFARDARLGGDMSFVRKGHKVRVFRNR